MNEENPSEEKAIELVEKKLKKNLNKFVRKYNAHYLYQTVGIYKSSIITNIMSYYDTYMQLREKEELRSVMRGRSCKSEDE